MPESKEPMFMIVNGKVVHTLEDYQKGQADLKRRREAERATFSEDDEEPKMSPEALALAKKIMAGEE